MRHSTPPRLYLGVLIASVILVAVGQPRMVRAAPVVIDHAALAEGNLMLAREQPLWGPLSLVAAAELPAAEAFAPATPPATNLQLAMIAATSLGPLDLSTQLVFHSADAPEWGLALGTAIGLTEVTSELAFSGGAWTVTPGVWVTTASGHAAGLRLEIATAGDAPAIALLSYSWRP